MAKRGRPALYPAEWYAQLDNIWPGKTKRGLQNSDYAGEALKAIKGMDNVYKFFFNGKKAKKISILTEIGRYGDSDLMRNIAQQVYDLIKSEGDRPVKEWEKILRNHRLQYFGKR